MLICTDKARADAIHASKQARDVHEIMRELYPDATFDGSRYHAPCDGYECELTGNVYRAGEFLPMSDEDPSHRVFTVDAICNGETIQWAGSKAQIAAVRAELLIQGRAKRAADNAGSKHVGEIGGKATFEAIIDFVKVIFGYYGAQYLHIMRDRSGNVIVYRGSKLLKGEHHAEPSPYGVKHMVYGAVGETIIFSAKVKEHGEFDGVKQTIVERPRIAPGKAKKAA